MCIYTYAYFNLYAFIQMPNFIIRTQYENNKMEINMLGESPCRYPPVCPPILLAIYLYIIIMVNRETSNKHIPL